MLSWVFIFLVLALIAGVLGFTGIVVVSVEIAKILFYIFLVMFFVTLIVHIIKR